MEFNGQALQDKCVLNVTKFKKNGFFVEIGSNDPKKINNSYILEHDYDWKGIMVEYDKKWLESYKKERPNSIHVIQDATTIDYKDLFEKSNAPDNIDYLQIDLEVWNGSTIQTLRKLDAEVMDKHKFAVVTFEHDVYCNNNNTRLESRAIFKKRGYVCVFEDICLGNPYEDWYVHPDLVDMEYIKQLQLQNESNYITFPQNKFIPSRGIESHSVIF